MHNLLSRLLLYLLGHLPTLLNHTAVWYPKICLAAEPCYSTTHMYVCSGKFTFKWFFITLSLKCIIIHKLSSKYILHVEEYLLYLWFISLIRTLFKKLRNVYNELERKNYYNILCLQEVQNLLNTIRG